MNDEEMQELIQNVFQKILKELKENPDNVFNYLELQKKYNTVLKDKAKLRQENKKLKEAINKAIEELYIWGEILNPEFQKKMLEILETE